MNEMRKLNVFKDSFKFRILINKQMNMENGKLNRKLKRMAVINQCLFFVY